MGRGGGGLTLGARGRRVRGMKELIFEVREDETDGGFTASALGLGIHTEGDSSEDLQRNIRDAVETFFDETMEAPRVIRLHFVRDEVFAL